MNFQIKFKEIFYLTILITIIALYLDIHDNNNVLMFVINHVFALLIALVVSKIIDAYIIKYYFSS